MQILEIINVGQAPNDGTGDDHRKAFQKVNANFGKAVEGIAEVGAAAQAAGEAAAAAIPSTEKGQAGGVASLDAEGKIPAQYLPEDGAFIPLSQKGVADGVATLGEDGKVTPEQLPNAVDAIPLAEKGQAGGVATLTAAGRLPTEQYPFSGVLVAGTDANSVISPGLFHINSDAEASAALNWPVLLAGTLTVQTAADGNLQVTQTYTTRSAPSGGAVRTFVRVRFGTDGGTWGTWQEIARAADLPTVPPLHGQCRFVYVSTTECRLLPFNGNKVVVNDSMRTIPSGGVAIASTALVGASGTTNYIYLYDNAGTLALEASTTGHSTHTNGVEIKTADPSRTLVGVAYKLADGQFIDAAALRGVASWFNRYYRSAQATNFNTGTASTSPVQAISPVYVWTWQGESTTSNINGRTYVNVAGASAYTFMYDDGNQSWSAAATSVSANAAVPVSLSVPFDNRAEGFHGVSTYLAVAGGGTSNCALTQSIVARP